MLSKVIILPIISTALVAYILLLTDCNQNKKCASQKHLAISATLKKNLLTAHKTKKCASQNLTKLDNFLVKNMFQILVTAIANVCVKSL